MGRFSTRLLACAALLAAGYGCLAPPALIEAREVDLEAALRTFPDGVNEVDLTAPDGTTRRGLWYAVGPEAPVVLHLLESSASIGTRRLGFGPLFSRLADLGFASLAFDYSGVGLSGGERSVDRLPRDANDFWAEAVRRAGGDASRVALRATSIGTLAAATLLDAGKRPGAVQFIAPVLADSATARYARRFHGLLAGGFAAVAYRDIVPSDLIETVEALEGVPLFISAPAEDLFLTDAERERMAAAVERAGGTWVSPSSDHIEAAIRSRDGLPQELEFLRAAFPYARPEPVGAEVVLARLDAEARACFERNPAALERLDALAHLVRTTPASLVAAAALAARDVDTASRLVWIFRQRPYERSCPGFELLGLEQVAEVLALDDPAGALDLAWLQRASRSKDLMANGFSVRIPPQLLAQAAAGDGAGWSMTVTVGPMKMEERFRLADVREDLITRGMSPEDALRQTTRIALRIDRIPERLRPDGRGGVRIEVFERDAWVPVEDSRGTSVR